MRPHAAALASALAACAALAAVPQAQAQAQVQAPPNLCGELKNHYGPYDYRKDRGEKLNIVEGAHFTHAIESLRGGVNTTRENVAGDITYTLHTFPNHHRALLALERLGDERKTDLPPSSRYTIECYYNRALRFAPDDTVVRILYARYLGKHKRKADAFTQLEAASDQADDNGFTHYNIGLMYFELGAYDRALQHAHKAQALGFDRPQLAEMLKRENKWQEPPPEAPAAPENKEKDNKDKAS